MLVTYRTMGGAIREIPIETIYIDENRSSHFNPLLDSMRIYFIFVRFGAISLITAAIDNFIFVLATFAWTSVLGCQIAARVGAGFFNHYANKSAVFHSTTRDRVTIPRYWLTVAFSGALSYALISFLVFYFSTTLIVAKLLAETLLFFVNFLIQRHFVFGQAPDRHEAAS